MARRGASRGGFGRKAAMFCSTSIGRGRSSLREKARGDMASIFVLPPTIPELERRLRTRALKMMSMSFKSAWRRPARRLSHWAEYDYVIINDDIESRLRAGARDPGGRTPQARAPDGTVRFCPPSAGRTVILGGQSLAMRRKRARERDEALDRNVFGAGRGFDARGFQQRRRIEAKRPQTLAQHFAALAERGFGHPFERAPFAGEGLFARHQVHQRRCHLGRRDEGAAGDIEQDARFACASRRERKGVRRSWTRARRRCARQPRAGTSARAGHTRVAMARA